MEYSFKMSTGDGSITIETKGKEIYLSVYNYSSQDYSYTILDVEEAELFINVIQNFVNVIKQGGVEQ